VALCVESSSGLARWQVQKRPLLQDCFGKLWSNGLGRKRLLPVSNANGRLEEPDRGVLPVRLQRAGRVATFPHPQGLPALRIFWIYCRRCRFRVLKASQDESPLKLPFGTRMANVWSASHECDEPLVGRTLCDS
jgi:hypothetical protein